MSISTALSNAYSGLSAVSRSAEIISNNVANALTDGYSRQEVPLSARVVGIEGGGVATSVVARATDPVATTIRRQSDASSQSLATEAGILERIATALGSPGEPTALSTRFANFETALQSAYAAPDSGVRLQQVLLSAQNLATSFNKTAETVSRIRAEADRNISVNVRTVNGALAKIQKLNVQIRNLTNVRRDTAAMQDQRQGLIDKINTIIPVRESVTSNGETILFSTGGEILLDGSAREISFVRSALVTPSMTIQSGALSGLTVDGRNIPVAAVGGGTLAADFKVRDLISVNFQQQLDALATDMIDRFQNAATDPTLPAGAAGLFTDAGFSFVPGNETGLSNRISVSAAIDPATGGDLWKLRAGLGATSPGIAGNGDQISRFMDALKAIIPAPAALNIPTPMSATGFAQELTSTWSAASDEKQQDMAFGVAQNTIFRQREMKATGVDSDREMQDLLVVEKAYAANARVISVIDRLMKTLLEI